jgi:GTPase SAR1 family protein
MVYNIIKQKGVKGSGKTTLIRNYLKSMSQEIIQELEEEKYKYSILGRDVVFIDTPDPNDNLAETKYWINNSSIFLLLLDITNEQSINRVKSLKEIILSEKKEDDIQILIILTKSDLVMNRKIQKEEIDKLKLKVISHSKNNNKEMKIAIEKMINSEEIKVKKGKAVIVKAKTSSNEDSSSGEEEVKKKKKGLKVSSYDEDLHSISSGDEQEKQNFFQKITKKTSLFKNNEKNDFSLSFSQILKKSESFGNKNIENIEIDKNNEKVGNNSVEKGIEKNDENNFSGLLKSPRFFSKIKDLVLKNDKNKKKN